MSPINKLTKGSTITEHINNLNDLISQINDLLSTVNKYSKVTTTGKFSDLLEIPEEFNPKVHTHFTADIEDLQIPSNVNQLLGYDKLALKSELPTDYLSSSLKGVANGLAELDITGKIPASQLPSYVDDVIEGYFISDTEFNDENDKPVTIEAGKIYADVDTNYIYRWSGTKLTRITGNLVLGETSSTAFRGDYGRIAYDHAISTHAPFDANKNVQIDWNEDDETSDSFLKNKPVLSKVATTNKYRDLDGLPDIPTITNDLTDSLKAKYDIAYNHSQVAHTPNTVATTSSNGLMSSIDKTNVDANTTSRHTHSNKSVLDTITADWINSLASQTFVTEKINAISIPDTSGFVPNTTTINGKALSSNVSLSYGDVKALPNYSITINHNAGGNPRMFKFVTVNYSGYTSDAAAYFKLGAMSCHGNGTSYQFLEDIVIGVTYNGTIVCNVYKFCQIAGNAVDGINTYYGDVFYVHDTTNKIIDFYILGGQYASSQFTPFTKIGSTTTSGITQYSGTATYYSSGDKIWANGNGSTYARTSDIPDVSGKLTGTKFATNASFNTYLPYTESGGGNTTPTYVATFVSNNAKNGLTYSSVSNLKTQIGIPNFVTLTQAEYDALSTKDANTYYFIKE